MFNHITQFATGLTVALRRVVTAAVVLFYACMLIAVLAQVLGRYVFGYSIPWAAETATFAQIWMVLLAAGIAMRRNLHVGVDVLVVKLPVRQRRTALALSGAACLWFFYHAILGSFALIEIGFIETSPALRLPMWIPYLCLPVGLSYFALEFMLALTAKWRDPHSATQTGADLA